MRQNKKNRHSAPNIIFGLYIWQLCTITLKTRGNGANLMNISHKIWIKRIIYNYFIMMTSKGDLTPSTPRWVNCVYIFILVIYSGHKSYFDLPAMR